MQLYRYFMSQSSEFCRHNPLCRFSTTVYCCKRIFRYRLSPETFGYTPVCISEISMERRFFITTNCIIRSMYHMHWSNAMKVNEHNMETCQDSLNHVEISISLFTFRSMRLVYKLLDCDVSFIRCHFASESNLRYRYLCGPIAPSLTYPSTTQLSPMLFLYPLFRIPHNDIKTRKEAVSFMLHTTHPLPICLFCI
jgi:hypothetical protein